MPRAPANLPLLRRFLLVALLGYLVLIVYGSLYPFSDWTSPAVPLFSFLKLERPKYISVTDIAVNVVVYIPLGLMLTGLMRRFTGMRAAIFVTLAFGAILSLAMETLQMFLPGRVSSVLDLGTNTFGTLLGALLAWAIHPRTRAGRRIFSWRNEWFRAGSLVDASLLILLLFLLAELPPLIPSLQGERTYLSVMPLWQAVVDSTQVPILETVVYALKVLAFGLFVSLLTLPDRELTRPILVLLGVALLAKLVGAALLSGIPLYAWRISLRAFLGLLFGLGIFALAKHLGRTPRAILAGATLVAVFAIQELTPGRETTSNSFNWVPFVGQMYGFTGILDIVAAPALFLAVAAIANLVTPWHRRGPIIWFGGFAAVALAFAFEFAQQFIPGRTPDITDVALYSVGWFIPWLWRPSMQRPGSAPAPAPKMTRLSRWPRRAVLALLIAGPLALVLPLVTTVVELPLDEKRMYRLPTPDELPPADLPNFRETHPRLPAPTPADIQRLQSENPEYLHGKEYFVKRGDLYPTILLARAFPGSQDIEHLYKRVMDVDVGYRGSNAELVALAYDWLYDQWTEEQRHGLRGKLADSAEFIIKIIRNERLSPYNVYLYNTPFQRLMAVTIALYHDDPRGDLPMRFTYDLWKHRILPVWRQVMGKNGGWHEGGEYIAIGIGQAVYELPAMWRSATGEDLFKTEPGIRGFMDFILYRLRPDGTHYRIGDASFSERIASDLTPLALEYRDAGAFSLRPQSRLPVPTGWPWGPFTDSSLYNPDAIKARPLSKLMDGIGIVVARSNWEPDATYVTFKAGDNFWSHSHLDQGSFTIFKGGPLAIDSGLYGPQYGSDHHMNYTYQSIAHNLITVTDPADTVPLLTKKGERQIANDGGQRRIGSGWGVEPAPLDLNEWQAKREIYHAGQIEQFWERDGITVAVADVTPAYTNSHSGEGTFSHRTRRVEVMRRTFGYDRVDDVIVVFDRVVATRPEFRKRWLLHTIERPDIEAGRFTVSLAPNGKFNRAGGMLTGVVLLPERRTIAAVGGQGMEFYVDGKNYDESGRLYQNERFRNDPDVGNWRIEVSPETNEREDVFLTVLMPTVYGVTPIHQIKLIRSDAKVGCVISAPHRSMRWLFDPVSGHAEISQIN
jgi:VanZ family protein